MPTQRKNLIWKENLSPQFLSSAYSKSCGTAFNDLNNKINVNVPKEPLAAGYGASATNEKMDLNRPITVRVPSNADIKYSVLTIWQI
jgi:hypothetical protein